MYTHYVYGIQIRETLPEALEASETYKQLERGGWSPELWEALRSDVRACKVPWEVWRRAWREFHPSGRGVQHAG